MTRGRRLIWRCAPWGIAVLLGAATLLVALEGFARDDRERSDARAEVAQSAAGALDTVLRETVERTQTVGGLYAASQYVSRGEFARFAAPLLDTSGANGVSWVERVTDARRATFERRLGSPIKRLGTDDRFERQMRRPVYHVVVRIRARQTTRSTVGLDVGAIAARAPSLRAAEAARAARATPIVTLAGSQKPGILIYAPVFAGGTGALRGFASGSYRLERLNADIRAVLPSGTGISVTQAGTTAMRSGDLTDAVTRSVTVAGRRWELAVAGPGSGGLGYGPASLLIGVPLSLLITLLVALMARRTQKTEAIAEERTVERDIAQQGRLESEERLTTAFEEAPIGMAMLGLDGAFVRVNHALADITGHSAARLLELGLPALVPADYHEEMGTALRAAQAHTFDPFTVEHPLIHVSGEWRWVAVHVAHLGDLADGPLLLAQVLDITERRRFETDLTRSSRYFELSRDLICTAGFDGYFKQLNTAWTHTLGWTEEELRSRPFLDLVHPDDRERTQQETAKLTSAGVTVSFVNRYATRGGGWRWIDWNASVAPDEDLIYASARNVTERMNAEAALEVSERQTRQILETAHDAFVSIDGAGRITDWNRRAEIIFGWTRDEALGRLVGDTIVPEALREAHRCGLERYLESGIGSITGQLIELTALHRDGSEFPVELTISPSVVAGGYAFNAFLRDVSERKRSEEELAGAHAQAIESSRLKSEFVANMSHEIRTPLNGIIGMTELLLESELGADQREFAQTAAVSGEALLEVINNVLDFSKIEAGKLELEQHDFDLHETIEDVCEMLGPAAREKGLELIAWIDSDVPTLVRGDRGRLRQVLINLVANAVKFTEAGEVRVRLVAVERRQGDTMITFEVSDTGVGIEPERVEQLFESFTQADASTTRRFGGTGLGLAICRQLVELMGGAIHVDSALGQGSRFRVTLALDVPVGTHPVDPERDVPDTLSTRAARVLLAEDNPVNRVVAQGMLGRWQGLTVTVADNGREAIERLDGESFDLVFMDCQMPELDGYDATREIRRREGGDARLPVIAMTANAMKGDRERWLESGMDDYLAKPLRLAELDAMLERWLPGGEAPSLPAPPTDLRTSAPSGSLVDPEHIRRLHAEYDGLAHELIAIFEQRTPELLDDLRAAAKNHDFIGLRRAAHKLRGSCLNVGATLMAKTCESLEQDEPGTGTGGLVDRLGTSLAPTVSALRAATAPAATA